MKIKTSLIVFMVTFCSVQAQSYQKGNKNFDILIGFAGYGGTIVDNATKVSSSAGAASLIVAPQISFGSGKLLSIGFALPYSHYLDSANATGGKPSLKGLDGDIVLDLHLLRKQKTDLMFGANLGLAGIRYNPDDGTGDIYGSLGSAADFHIMARFYLNDQTGIIARIGFPAYKFSKFGRNTFDTYTITFSGFSIMTGIAFNLGGGSSE